MDEDVHHKLTLQCHALEVEVATLREVKLLGTLFHLTITNMNGEGRPDINGLRFSHQPETEIRLGCEEINETWIQAIQMVVFVVNLVEFRTRSKKDHDAH